jgi:hypothetical protein
VREMSTETVQANKVIKIHIDDLYMLGRKRHVSTILREILRYYNVEILAQLATIEYYDYPTIDDVSISAKDYEIVKEEIMRWNRYEELTDVLVERIRKRLEKKYKQEITVVALCDHGKVSYAFVMRLGE